MSAQPSDISSSQSNVFIQILEKLFHISILNQNIELIAFVQWIVRKGAHAFSYFLLTILFIQMFKHIRRMKSVGYYSMTCSFLYACSDEFHQLFVAGRAGRFQDVLIDSCGALVALSLYFIIQKYQKKKQNEHCS